jgi:predicted kinase
MLRRIVLVTGPPASGKTTLAGPLADALHFTHLAKDEIKESLFTTLKGRAGDARFSRRLSTAATDLLWVLAPHFQGVVLEANFRTQRPEERAKLSALLSDPGASLVEVHCRLPLEMAARRFSERARNQRHHPAHVLKEMSPEQLAEYAEPFALTPVIEVDTTQPIDIPSLANQITVILSEAEESRR